MNPYATQALGDFNNNATSMQPLGISSFGLDIKTKPKEESLPSNFGLIINS